MLKKYNKKHTYIHTHTYAKMAEDVCEGIENVLNFIVSTAERSGNLKKN